MEQTQTNLVNGEGCSRVLYGSQPGFRLGRKISIWSFLGLIIGIVYLTSPGNVGAQVTILHSFGGGGPSEGVLPNGGLVLGRDGALYGTTVEERVNGPGFPSGMVFRFDPSSRRLTDLKSFTPHDHQSPESPLLLFNGGIVGIIAHTNRMDGQVFHLNASGNVEIWHQFGLQTNNGNGPFTPLNLASDGNIYGATTLGGEDGWGTVYKLNPANHQMTLVYSFTYGDVYRPSYLLLGQDGNFYGFAWSSSGTVIFMMTPAGALTTLYTFSVQETGFPTLMQASDGTFYGTTESLGTYQQGSVFKMTGTSPTVTVTVLHSFGQGNDGAYPIGPVVVGPNGNLYGETAGGGTGEGGAGIIYEITKDGSTYTVVHNFDDGSIPNDGNSPSGGLTVGADNNLYGTTAYGGAYNKANGGFGTLFRLSP